MLFKRRECLGRACSFVNTSALFPKAINEFLWNSVGLQVCKIIASRFFFFLFFLLFNDARQYWDYVASMTGWLINWWMRLGRGKRSIGRKSGQVPFCSPKSSCRILLTFWMTILSLSSGWNSKARKQTARTNQKTVSTPKVIGLICLLSRCVYFTALYSGL
jgi:hypothetical protein